MRSVALAFLAVISLSAEASLAQLTAEPAVRFIVPEAAAIRQLDGDHVGAGAQLERAQVVDPVAFGEAEEEPVVVRVARVGVHHVEVYCLARSLELSRHIALEDPWMLDAVANGEFAPVPEQSDACGLMTPADCVKSYRAAMPPVDRVKSLSGDALVREIAFLSMTVRHSVQHRGQLAAYLRANGRKGPADSRPERRRAHGLAPKRLRRSRASLQGPSVIGSPTEFRVQARCQGSLDR